MNASINIVYPIEGGTYPVSNPVCGSESTYFTASFSTTSRGGGFKVEWGFDREVLGSGEYYDQMTAQFVWKLPEGKHIFWVQSGESDRREVEFFIG
jgi:hypothetical protein